ncbi:eukaryotic translation initiation factor 3 subunit A [Leptopilina heterotoma]|uniref:eukaryotic translation initiation factor 3 subunit A n=1 Tax=Leptopilina heterotoma TaxID=63436 RepID=UPI001CA95560|nr:eukaryotic translation initiation factor 3 subunit A [Leptopilina heterotoma]
MMFYNTVAVLLLLSQSASATESTTHVITPTASPSVASTLGALYRQARSDQYNYASRYSNDNAPQTSGIVGIRSDGIEHRDAAYYESRCITCDPNKSATADRGNYNWRLRQRPKNDYYEDEPEDRRYRDRYDYYDRARTQNTDYDRYDPYQRNDLLRPLYYNDRYDTPNDRYGYYDRGSGSGSDRPYDPRLFYERPYERPSYERNYERGNGYDNLDTRYPSDDRNDRYNIRRPTDDAYDSRYDRYYRYYMSKYDRNDPYERSGWRRPYDDRYDRYGGRDPANSRGYYSSGSWSPGYDRGYASGWNYSGSRDSWRDSNRDRDRDREGFYRPRDYFYDSTAAPGGSRGTSYIYDRPESSTKPDSSDRDKPTSSPLTQDNKNYKD